MQENALHAALKTWYAGDSGQVEVLLDGYLIDVVKDGQLVEIQTRSFSAIKSKLMDLVERHPVRLVHPIALEKWIVHLPVQGEQVLYRRKSPRKGRLEFLFSELIRFPELVEHPSFSIEVVFTREEEIRRDDGRGSWRRGGVSIVDRRLLQVVGQKVFNNPQDFLALLPPELPLIFNNPELAKALALNPNLARKMTYCLKRMGAIRMDGKRGRSFLYTAGSEAYNLPRHTSPGEYDE